METPKYCSKEDKSKVKKDKHEAVQKDVDIYIINSYTIGAYHNNYQCVQWRKK